MNGRWITVSLVALALAGCHKKEAAKPPPPTTTTTETAQAPTPAVVPATPPTTPATAPPTVPAPATDTTVTEPTPPAPGGTPVTTPDAPRSFVPTKPLRMAVGSSAMVMAPRPGARPQLRPVKSKAQLKAEHDVLGLWTEQKNHSVINFMSDGRVTYVDKITDKPIWKGDWKAAPDGSVEFGLGTDGASGSIQYTAYPTAANIMAVAPHWTPEWGGSGQYAFEKMH